MTFRLPFQISRVGALCRPVSPDGLVSRLASRKGNLKKLILYQIKQDPSVNLLQECKHKITYVPTRYSTTKLNGEHAATKRSPIKSVKKTRSKLIVKEGEASDYYHKMDEINFGPYFNRRPTQVKSKMKCSRMKCNTQLHHHPQALPKYDYYGMETYFNEIKNIEDTMSTTAKPVITPPEPEIANIMPESDLKIQNDIWKQSGPEIINNLNSKNSMWNFIYGKRKTLKHELWKNISTTKMLNKFIQTPATPSKSSAKGSRIHLGTKSYANIYLSKKRKPVKLNLDNGNKVLPIPSNLQQRLLHKTRKCKTNKERKVDGDEEKSSAEISEEYNTQTSACGGPNAIPDVIETKNLFTECKYKVSHLPLKLTASKIFVRHQSKSSKTNLQPSDTFIRVNRKSFSKPNVIMATVNNRLLNNPSPEFMEQYSYNNSFYHMNAMRDMENYNDADFKYPKICYNAENDTYLLHNELVAEGVIQNETMKNFKTLKTSEETEKPAISTTPIVSIKPATSSKKIIKSISVKKNGATKKPTTSTTTTTPKVKTLKTTNEGIIRQCTSKTVHVSNVQSAKAANLEELNEAVSESKPKMVKLDTPTLSKKRDQKGRNKIKTSRIPKTLGEIYGVGKIPFLVEVSKPGQANHKQYLVVIQLPENKRQESSENNTNSPIPLTLNTDFNSDLLKETLLSPHDSLTDCFKATETNAEQTVTTSSKKYVPKVGSMIGLVKVKNKILPLLEINDYKGFEPLLPTKLSQLIQPKINNIKNKNNNKKEDLDVEWTPQKTFSQYRMKGEEASSKDADEQPQQRVAAYCSPSATKATERYEKVHDQLQRIIHTTEYIKDQRKSKAPVICKHVRQYSTTSRRNQTAKTLNYKILPKVRHTNRNVEFQQKRNYNCRLCPRCGQCPCVCCGQCPCACCGCCPCTPCGWYPCNSCRPQCCPKFKLDYCCPRGRWDCSIPIPPCRKIEPPYPSYGESMPMWCKEPTECFDYDQHILQPKNQVSQKIPLMEDSIPKVTVVDPALQRKCCRDKWCEPCYPHVDQRICFDCPYKVPVDYCCPRGRPHCYCWPERACTRKPPPYRCFSDEDLEFPEVEVTEHDLARKFASDLYRRMGKKCRLPFAPACTVDCDLRSGEPKPVCKHDPKGHCATTCLPPGTYPACCTPVRIPPCQIPGCDTCINCCMPMEGIKKTRCAKRCCPADCCGYCAKEQPQCCPKECPKDCPCPKSCDDD